VASGELDGAHEALDSCLAITSAGQDWHGLIAQVHLARAVCEAGGQNWEDALDQFKKAVDVGAKYGLALYQAEAQFQWALAHLSRRWRGDEEQARELLEQSLANFRSCGARRHAERAANALKPISRVAARDTVEFMLPISSEESARARGEAARDGNVTIFFSDIESSTEMAERLGDERAREVLRAHNSMTRLEIEKQGGTEVKALGDGFMVGFASVRRAILCVVGIQRAMEGYNRDNPDEPVRVRIGLHTGPTIREEEDFFGITVIKAARITDAAHGGQIVVSDAVRGLAGGLSGIGFTSIGDHSLKGLKGKHMLYEVSW
jgi:class 3 adenylate cyclase